MHPLKIPPYIVHPLPNVIQFDKSMDCNELQPLNAPAPISVTLDVSPKDFSLGQLIKDSFLIVLQTFRITDSRFLQS